MKFTPIAVALAFSSCSTPVKSVSEANSDVKAINTFTLLHEFNKENFHARFQAESISSSTFDRDLRPTVGRHSSHPDVGILQGKTRRRLFGNALRNNRVIEWHNTDATKHVPRFLQEKVPQLCGTNGTCPPSACDCRANMDLFVDQCTPILDSVCKGYVDETGKEWNIGGCINDYQNYPDLHDYLKTWTCQLAGCVEAGGTYGSCLCQLYESACKIYGDERLYVDDTRALGLCAAATCCQNKTDEAGRKSCTFGSSSRSEYRREHPRCGTNGTCYPGFCDAFVNSMGFEDLAAPFDTICKGVTDATGKQWEFEGCYRDYPGYPDYHLYLKTAYCMVSSCLVKGGSYGSCFCETYHTLCEKFGDARKYNYYPNKAGLCTIDACCQSKSTEAGRMSCFELTNSTTPTTSPELVEDASNTSSQNGSSSTLENGAPSMIPLSSVGTTTSALVTAAAAALTLFGGDVII